MNYTVRGSSHQTCSELPDEIKKSPRRRKARHTRPIVLPCAVGILPAVWSAAGTPCGAQRARPIHRSCGDKHKALGLPSETLNSEFLRGFMQNIGCEVAPVTAVLGGQLAQDVITVLGQNQQPIQNFVIFDGNTMAASMYPLHPEGELGSNQLKMSSSVADLTSNGAAGSDMLGGVEGVMLPVGVLPPVDMSMSQLPIMTPDLQAQMPPPPRSE